MKYLVDANVLSEPTKPAPNESVVEWLRQNERELVVIPVILGELKYGILILPSSRRRKRLEEWFSAGVQRLGVLDFDVKVAAEWSRLLARIKRRGKAMPIKDSLIAATALAYGLTMATRDVADFKNAGVKVVNPFAG